MDAPVNGSVSEQVMRDGRVKYRVRLWVDGKRKSLGLYDSREEAEGALDEAKQRLGPVEPGLTLRAWGARWLTRRGTDGIHRSANNDELRWRSRINSAAIANMKLSRITRVDVVRFLRDLMDSDIIRAKTKGPIGKREVVRKTIEKKRISPRTVRNVMNLLRCALRDAADEGLIPSNPAADVRVPRGLASPDAWTFLTIDEIKALHAALDARCEDASEKRERLREAERAIHLLALYTGARGGELWGLRWCDVHLEGDAPAIVVRVSYLDPTKTGRIRRIPLLPPAVEALKRWQRYAPGVARALVFPADGGGLHFVGFDAEWGDVKAEAKIARKVRFYDLRHTCASHLVIGSWTPRALTLLEVKDWLGHTSITTTMRYAHLAPDALSEAVKAPATGQQVDNRGKVRAIGSAKNRPRKKR